MSANQIAVQSLNSNAMLVELNISCWTARKLDKGTTQEVVSNKNAASRDAARVNKSLFAGRTELKELESYAADCRAYMYTRTLPWSDNGLRLIPVTSFMDFDREMQRREREFSQKVEDFITLYPTLITAQAMALGDMFKRDDYPLAGDLRSKFSFHIGYLPVPTAGDFRVDVGLAAQDELRERLEQINQQRVDSAMRDIWQRLGEHLKRMSDRLTVDTVDGEEKGRVFRDTLVAGAWELVDVAKVLNVTGDPALDEAVKMLKSAIEGRSADTLRSNPAARVDTKAQVDSILSKFDF